MIDLYNGDCVSVLRNTIKDESIDLIVTDCPYKIIAGGITINEDGKAISDGSKLGNKWLKKNSNETPSAAKNGKMFKHNDIKFSDWLPELYRVLKKGSHCYIMINGRNLKDLQVEAENAGFVFQNLLVWHKPNSQTPNKYYMQCLEFILMLSKRPARNINNLGSKNILSINNIIGNKIHPTEKPIELMDVMINNSSNENDIILDPFMGSGSTGVSCKKNNRKFIGIEIDDNYFKIAEKRINDYGTIIENMGYLF